MSHPPCLSPRAAASVIAALALTAPASALGAPQWTPTTDLTAPLTTGQVLQAVTPLANGQPLTSWAEGSSAGSFSSAQQTAPGALVAAGLSSADVPGGFLPGGPSEEMQIVALPNGGAVAVWRTIDATFTNPQVATSNYDATTGAWSAPVILAPTGGVGMNNYAYTRPALAVSASGALAVAAVQGVASGPPQLTVWRRPAGATAWSAPEQAPADLSSGYASTPDYSGGVSLAFAADDSLTAAWLQPGPTQLVATATRSASGTWTATGVLGFDGGYPLATAIATTPSGRTTVVWADVSRNALFTADRAAGATSWSEPTNLNSFPFSMQPGVTLSVNASGDMAAGATVSAGSPIPIVATRASDGDWETTLPSFSPSFGAGYRPMLAIDGNGATTLVTMTGMANITALRKREGSDSWTSRSFYGNLSGGTMRIGADAAGSATIAWSGMDSSTGNPVLKSATFDGTGPIQSGVSIPSTAKVDVPAAFSLSAKDVASATGATTWSFGDGSSATGTTASHTFRAPGAYTVKATSVDSLGNESVTTREVVVDGATCKGDRDGTKVTVKCDLGFDPGDKVKVNGRIQRVRADGKLALVRAKTRTTTSTGKFTLVFNVRGVRKGTYAVTIAPRNASKQVVKIDL